MRADVLCLAALAAMFLAPHAVAISQQEYDNKVYSWVAEMRILNDYLAEKANNYTQGRITWEQLNTYANGKYGQVATLQTQLRVTAPPSGIWTDSSYDYTYVKAVAYERSVYDKLWFAATLLDCQVDNLVATTWMGKPLTDQEKAERIIGAMGFSDGVEDCLNEAVQYVNKIYSLQMAEQTQLEQLQSRVLELESMLQTQKLEREIQDLQRQLSECLQRQAPEITAGFGAAAIALGLVWIRKRRNPER